MKKIVIAAACLLSGCAAQHLAQMHAQANQGAALCRAEIPSVVGNHVRLNQCIADANDRAGFTSPRQGLINATRMELAEKLDAGKITQAEANAEMAQLRYQVSQDEAAERVARTQAAAAFLTSMPQQAPYQVPAYQMQPRTVTNCTSTGAGSGIISTSCY